MDLQTLSQAQAQAAAQKLKSLASQLWIYCSRSIAANLPTQAEYSWANKWATFKQPLPHPPHWSGWGFLLSHYSLTSILFLLLSLLLSFLLSLFPPTPNPLPSGKRALRFASLGFNPSPPFFSAFKPTFSYWAADVNPPVRAPRLFLSFLLSLFLPPTPNPLINDLKPTSSYWAADVNPPVLAPRLFLSFLLFLFLPPTPNPLPSGKRALRFACPGSS